MDKQSLIINDKYNQAMMSWDSHTAFNHRLLESCRMVVKDHHQLLTHILREDSSLHKADDLTHVEVFVKGCNT